MVSQNPELGARSAGLVSPAPIYIDVTRQKSGLVVHFTDKVNSSSATGMRLMSKVDKHNKDMPAITKNQDTTPLGWAEKLFGRKWVQVKVAIATPAGIEEGYIKVNAKDFKKASILNHTPERFNNLVNQGADFTGHVAQALSNEPRSIQEEFASGDAYINRNLHARHGLEQAVNLERAIQFYEKGISRYETEGIKEADLDTLDKAVTILSALKDKLGRMYFNPAPNSGVQRNVERAVELFAGRVVLGYSEGFDQLENVARSDDGKAAAAAEYQLGKCYEQGIGIGLNVNSAFRYYEAAAKKGHPQAQYQLGKILEEGVYVERDPQGALEYYGKAAHQGNAEAQNRMGELYLYIGTLHLYLPKEVKFDEIYLPKEVKFNESLAIRFFSDSAQKEHTQALENLKKMADKDGVSEEKAKACLALGELYADGIGGVKNKDEAIRWYTAGFELANPDQLPGFERKVSGFLPQEKLLYSIGKMFLEKPNTAEAAINYLKKAAQNGFVDAAYMLGDLYLKNIHPGVKQDFEKAKEYYQIAAAASHPGAFVGLGEVYLMTKEDEKAAKAFQQVPNDPVAQYNLGCLYYDGTGVKKDIEVAVTYFEKAAEGGSVGAFLELQKMANRHVQQGDRDSALAKSQGSFVLREMENERAGPFREQVPAQDLFELGRAYLHAKGDINTVGRLHDNAESRILDPEKGVSFLQRAAEAGHQKAFEMLQAGANNPDDLPLKSLAQEALIKMERSQAGVFSSQVSAPALLALGKLYMDGDVLQHIERDMRKAALFFGRAMEKGSAEAAQVLQSLVDGEDIEGKVQALMIFAGGKKTTEWKSVVLQQNEAINQRDIADAFLGKLKELKDTPFAQWEVEVAAVERAEQMPVQAKQETDRAVNEKKEIESFLKLNQAGKERLIQKKESDLQEKAKEIDQKKIVVQEKKTAELARDDAVAKLKPFAEEGHLEVQQFLATLYYERSGQVGKEESHPGDREQALYWFEKVKTSTDPSNVQEQNEAQRASNIALYHNAVARLATLRPQVGNEKVMTPEKLTVLFDSTKAAIEADVLADREENGALENQLRMLSDSLDQVAILPPEIQPVNFQEIKNYIAEQEYTLAMKRRQMSNKATLLGLAALRGHQAAFSELRTLEKGSLIAKMELASVCQSRYEELYARRDTLEKEENKLMAGYLTEALRLWTEAAKLGSRNAVDARTSLYLSLGDQQVEKGNSEAAVKCYQEAAKQWKVRQAGGNQLIDGKIVTVASSKLQTLPRDPEALCKLGLIYHEASKQVHRSAADKKKHLQAARKVLTEAANQSYAPAEAALKELNRGESR